MYAIMETLVPVAATRPVLSLLRDIRVGSKLDFSIYRIFNETSKLSKSLETLENKYIYIFFKILSRIKILKFFIISHVTVIDHLVHKILNFYILIFLAYLLK